MLRSLNAKLNIVTCNVLSRTIAIGRRCSSYSEAPLALNLKQKKETKRDKEYRNSIYFLVLVYISYYSVGLVGGVVVLIGHFKSICVKRRLVGTSKSRL
jgi:hypothetical protein